MSAFPLVARTIHKCRHRGKKLAVLVTVLRGNLMSIHGVCPSYIKFTYNTDKATRARLQLGLEMGIWTKWHAESGLVHASVCVGGGAKHELANTYLTYACTLSISMRLYLSLHLCKCTARFSSQHTINKTYEQGGRDHLSVT